MLFESSGEDVTHPNVCRFVHFTNPAFYSFTVSKEKSYSFNMIKMKQIPKNPIRKLLMYLCWKVLRNVEVEFIDISVIIIYYLQRPSNKLL